MKDNRTRPLTWALALLLGLSLMVPSPGLCTPAATASEARKGIDAEGVVIPDEYDGQVILEDPELIADVEEDEEAVATPPDSSATSEPAVTTDPTAEPTPALTPEVTPGPTIEPSGSPDSTKQPESTDEPVLEYRYTIKITPPAGWRNTASATVEIQVTDDTGNGWDSIFVKNGNGGWQEVTEAFLGANRMEMDVRENGPIVVRVTDPAGEDHEENAQVACFDRTPPSVTAGIRNVLLHVEAKDTQSGVAGIQVNGLLFTVLQDGTLDVRIEDLLREYEKLGVRAYDYAGNFSAPVTLDNPYYGTGTCPTCPPSAPPTQPPPTKAPSTQAPATKKPSGNGSGKRPTPKPTLLPTQAATPTPSFQANATLSPIPSPTPAYIAVGPGAPLSSGGNMQTLDLLYSKATNKQFISVQTRSGETYYLIIDYDKPIDEEAEMYETYFLNLVDDRDLLSVLSADELPTPEPTVLVVTPQPTQIPAQEPVQVQKKASNGLGGIILALILALAGGGALWFFKIRKPSLKTKSVNEYAFDDGDEDDATEDTEDE